MGQSAAENGLAMLEATVFVAWRRILLALPGHFN